MKLTEVLVEQDINEFSLGISSATPTSSGTMSKPSVGPTVSSNQPASGLAGGQMNPAQAAQATKERQEQKKQVQDQIKATEQQLMDLRKKLAELG